MKFVCHYYCRHEPTTGGCVSDLDSEASAHYCIKLYGFTAIELLVALVSIFTAFCLAVLVVRHFESAWRWLGATVVFIVGYIVIYFCLLVSTIYLVGRLSEWLDKRRHLD
jgi:MFS family permease